MNEDKKTSSDEINLFDIFLVLLKRKKLILGITFGIAFLVAIISLIIPSIYKAETKILISQQSSFALTNLLPSAGGLALIAPDMLGVKTTENLYAEMFKSNFVLDRIIDRFQLMKLYDVKYRSSARSALRKNTFITVDKKSGIITVAVEDKDPKRAAEMANAFVEELKNLTKGLAVTEASQRRLFFEEQLKDTKEALLKMEEDFKKFQEKTGAIKVEEQAKAVISSISALRAQIAAKEVELRVMKTYATPNNPDLKKLEESLKAMKAQLASLERKGGSNPDPLMPTGRMPEVEIQYLRKFRDLKFYETLHDLLLKGYEQSKLDEAKDTVVIQVIDKATPPERRAKPQRKFMVAIATTIGFLFSICLAFIAEYKDRLYQNPEGRKKIEAFKTHLNFKIKLPFKKSD